MLNRKLIANKLRRIASELEDANYPLFEQALAQLSGWKPAPNFSPFQRNGNALDSYDLNISTKKPTPSGDLGMYPCIEIDPRLVAFVNSEWDLATEIDMKSLSSVEELKSAIKSEIPHLYSTVKDLWW